MSGSFRDTHGTDEEWLDYARSLAEPGRAAELAFHLDTGCVPCAATVSLWKTTSDIAVRARASEPPEPLIRQARGTFALHHAAKGRPTLASLVFDSFLEPQRAGVRSAERGPRQLMYRAGRYVVRLRAEGEPAGGRTSLVGQILDEERPGAFLSDVTVMAFSGSEAIDQTLTNRLGEFALDAAAASDLKLAIGLAENGFLTVALPIAGPDDGPAPSAKRLNWK